MSNKIVPQTYRSVIDDVINSIRSEFDEYGVSEDVLGDLQTRWESKIIASHVAEFEPDPKQAPNSSTPPSNHTTATQPSFPPPPPPPHPSQYPHLHPHPYPPHPHHQYQNGGPLPPISVKSEPGLNDSRFTLSVGQAMNLQTYVLPHPPHPPQHPLPGLPGSSESSHQFQQPPQAQQPRRAGGPPPWVSEGAGKGKARQEGIAYIPQLDGPSSTSSASSSTPPPGAGLTGSTTAPPRPDIGASEEINSDLDDSDSDGEAAEEAETGGPEQDIVFCTYDKVARVKNKWKCVLKDGMVHVNGKDYLFAKCTGYLFYFIFISHTTTNTRIQGI
ncbi:transcription factor IIA, alpha/beta subunit [Ramaria rubella]|nr:transcription factor IIA, alpha/beta subunit [Ramaria rubella]